ncbi:GNAT family N-acetyltransferase [Rahnella sp. PCH160]|uniref:GNAT family N-acetyltransferase n=1 Tax=Rahnella sp. PCH160 TaxID=3447928 RepID=UPI0039FC2358
MFITNLLGWEEGTLKEYQECYNLYGGNFSTHPDVIELQRQLLNIDARYFIRADKKGSMQGGICVWGAKMLANDYDSKCFTHQLSLPVAKDELILPISNSRSFILPFKSKIISSIHRASIINTTYTVNSQRHICIAKDVDKLSIKTRQTRKKEFRTFLAQGGEVHRVEDFSATELVEIYSALFFKRRLSKINHKTELAHFLDVLKKHTFGSILFIDNSPVAFQLIMKAESPDIISYDYINIGLDTSYSKLSLGTVITWLNINEASEECQRKGKKMRFSFGKPTADYKNRWCLQEPLGRTITL